MKRNKYAPYDSKWPVEDWLNKCPNYQYRLLRSDEIPEFLPSSLTDKFNSALLMCSGSNDHYTFVLQGYRIDGEQIDEHQYVATFDQAASKSYAGFIEHADYNGRTTDIPIEMQESMSASGIYIDYPFPRKPTEISGSIFDLDSSGLFDGFKNSVTIQNKKQS